MTITSTNNRVNYTADGAETVYAYTFRIIANTDLVVTLRDTNGIETTQTLTTHYTVTGVGTDAGGNVTFVTAPTEDYVITIRRVRPLTQTADIRNQGDFYPETHEDAFDHFIMIDQAYDESVGRCVRLPVTVPATSFDPVLPAGIEGSISRSPVTNATGTGWEVASNWPSAASIAAAATNAASAAASALAASNSAGTNTPYAMSNIGLATSISGNVLTISLTQADGVTLPTTGTGAVRIYFRSATLLTGSLTEVPVTGALTLDIASGATLGHNDALADYIYIYALNNAGTCVLGASSSSHFDEGSLVSTTAMTSSSDDASVMYSASALTNVTFRLIGRLLSTQTTAGTWAAAMTEVTVGNLGKKDHRVQSRAAHFTAKHGVQYLVSAAAARNIQLPTPKSGWYMDIKDSTLQSGTNAFTLVRSGSELIETVAGNYTLSENGGFWRVTSDGTNYFITVKAGLVPASLVPLGECQVDSGNGHGSTNIYYRRFSNIRKNDVTGAITYADSATLGGSFTINQTGIYSVTVGEIGAGGAGSFFGISVNGVAATDIVALTYANGRRSVSFAGDTVADYVTWVGKLTATDVVRHHTAGSPTSTSAQVMVNICQVARLAA